MTEQEWTDFAKKALVGRKIIKVQYMTEKNAESLDWHQRPLMLKLDDDTLLLPQADDEGNDGGALLHHNPKAKNDELYPVLWRYPK